MVTTRMCVMYFFMPFWHINHIWEWGKILCYSLFFVPRLLRQRASGGKGAGTDGVPSLQGDAVMYYVGAPQPRPRIPQVVP
jgi:hypothetical protein